jgi:hypothetical protein
MWLHAWFAGAAMVTPENSIAIFFEDARPPWNLTEHGKKAAEVFSFMRSHDRGVPYTPVAVVLDHLSGYNAYQGRPWGILEMTPGDQETYDLLEQQIFLGADHIHVPPDPDNPEASYLRPTPYGESFDVLLSTASADVLQTYPVILLVGDMEFPDVFVEQLVAAAVAGSRLLLHERHALSLGARLQRLKEAGSVEVLSTWTNPATGRPAAISNERLSRLIETLLPVTIEGTPVQYQINRNEQGWVVELVHNGGVIKRPEEPAVVDHHNVAQVVLRPRVPVQSAREWRSHTSMSGNRPLNVEIPPGQTRFVELILTDEAREDKP